MKLSVLSPVWRFVVVVIVGILSFGATLRAGDPAWLETTPGWSWSTFPHWSARRPASGGAKAGHAVLSLASGASAKFQPLDAGEDLVVDNGDTHNINSSEFYNNVTVGDTGNGTITQSGGMLNASGLLQLGLGADGNGSYIFNGGNVNAGSTNIGVDGSGTFTQSGGAAMLGNLYLGVNAGSHGAYNLQGGSGGMASSTLTASSILVGVSGSGMFLQSTGNVTVNGTAANGNLLIVGTSAGSTGNYFLLGGMLTTPQTIVSDDANTSVFTQSGGTHFTGQLILTGFSADSNGTYNLNGGTLTTGSVTSGDPIDPDHVTGTSTFNFNGGTLKAAGNSTNFMQGLTTANVQTNGAIIDTDTYTVTISQPLVHDASLNGGDGGLTKLGSGTLTLTGASTYSGYTFVKGGTLTFATGSSLGNPNSYSDSISVGSGATLNVNGSLNVLGMDVGFVEYNSVGTSPGTVNQNVNLYLAENLVVGYGTYNLNGAETGLSASHEYIGYDAYNATAGTYASFAQHGGHNNMLGLTLGGSSGSSGSVGNYSLQGGTLYADTSEYIYNGHFFQSPNTSNVTTSLIIYSIGPGSSYYDLQGGTLTVAAIAGSDYGRFYFNGGTLGVRQDNTLLMSGVTGVVGAAGAIIDTNPYSMYNLTGFNATVTSPFITGVQNGTDGGLTKLGLGTLRFAPVDSNGTLTLSYTGPTNVNAGTLTFDAGTKLTNYSAATVSAGATLNVAGTIQTGNLTVDGTSTRAATFNLTGSGALTTTGTAYIGYDGIGVFNQTGGTYGTTGPNGNTFVLLLGNNVGSTGTYNLSGTALSAGEEIIGNHGTGIFTQTGGVNTPGTAGGLVLANAANGTGTYTLSGGTLTADAITGGGGTSTFNFNGGILQTATGGSHTLFQSVTTVNVQAGGAHVNLVKNASVTFSTGLQHDPALGATLDGGLTKDGSGTLTLAGGGSYTGLTNVTGGTVNVPAGATLSVGAVQVVQATLNVAGQLNFGDSINADGTGRIGLALNGSLVAPAAVTLSDGGALSGDYEFIGGDGYGVFTQTGGTHTITGGMYLGDGTNSNGAYTLSGNNSYLYASQEYIGFSGRGTFTQNGGVNVVDSFFTVGGGYQGGGTYTLNAGNFSAPYQIIGTGGAGYFYQNGGGNSFSTLTIGDAPNPYLGGYGSYILAGDAGTILEGVTEYVGSSGDGSFTQTGGTHMLVGGNGSGGYLYLGYAASGTGSYYLSGTTATLSALNQYDGYDGTGYFTQSDGRNTAYYLYLGYNAGGKGTYSLEGMEAVLGSITQYVGYSGTGTFIHSAGENDSNQLYLGYNSGSAGSYALSGAGFRFSLTEYIGYTGTGTFTQTGGTNMLGSSTGDPDPLDGAMFLGYNANSSGTYDLSGTNAALSAFVEYVGYDGAGTFTQNGGSNTVRGTLTLGNGAGGSGTYALSSGTLQAAAVAGGAGTSTFNFNGGTLQANSNNAAFVQGLTTANVQAGGVVIDTNGYRVTVAQNLLHDTTANAPATDGGLTKIGSGTLTLTGASTYAGPTAVTAGTLLVNGTHSGAGTVTVQNSGSTLGGTGTLAGPITVGSGGAINPGDNNGAAGSASVVGTLHVGALTLNSGASMIFDVNGPTLYDQVSSTGAVNLGGSTLVVSIPSDAAFTNGQTLDLVHTTGTLGGTFAGITDGGMYTFGSGTFQAVYTGTDFELVALGVTPVPESATWLAGSLTLLLGIPACRRQARRTNLRNKSLISSDL